MVLYVKRDFRPYESINNSC